MSGHDDSFFVILKRVFDSAVCGVLGSPGFAAGWGEGAMVGGRWVGGECAVL